MGSPNEGVPYFAGNSCYLPRIASMACMLGGSCVMDCSQFLPKRYDDPRYTVPEYCIVWGHQPFYSNADGFYGHWILDLMKRGMKVAVVDPQLTWLAARAGKDWLRVRPGGDGALAMAMLKVICDEKLYDKEFCDKWVYGLEAVCERVADMDLDELCEPRLGRQGRRRARGPHLRDEPSCGHPVGRRPRPANRRASRLLTPSRQCGASPATSTSRAGNVMADACWGIEQPNWVGTWGWDELMTPEEQAKRIGIERYPMFAVGFKNLSSNATIEAWQRGEIPIHAAYIVTNNFLATMGAQAEQQLEWYKQIDFIVVEDLFMTPTMMALADVVLPAATYEERDGFGGLNAYRISCINKATSPSETPSPTTRSSSSSASASPMRSNRKTTTSRGLGTTFRKCGTTPSKTAVSPGKSFATPPGSTPSSSTASTRRRPSPRRPGGLPHRDRPRRDLLDGVPSHLVVWPRSAAELRRAC